jgi:hypothetical protein
MKYLCLIYVDEKLAGALPEGVLAGLLVASRCEADPTRPCLATELEPAATATTLRTRSGAVLTSAGPVTQTREQLGGLVLIDAPNLDAAIAIAARVPAARLGSIEVRPVLSLTKSIQN